jgi:hypothetical protein
MTRTPRIAVLSLVLTLAAGWAFAQSGWQSADLGNTIPGSTNIAGGVFTIQGNGSDIYGNADDFRFVYLEADADCEIHARVVSQENTNEWAKAGVMIRQAVTAPSQHVHINRNPGDVHGIEFQYRTDPGGFTTGNYSGGVNVLPKWIRLKRVGNHFTSWHADDVGGRPGAWTEQGQTDVTMSGKVYVGLSVLSHVNGTLSRDVFDNVVTTGTKKAGAGIIIARCRSIAPHSDMLLVHNPAFQRGVGAPAFLLSNRFNGLRLVRVMNWQRL